jgi:hypothetical protein
MEGTGVDHEGQILDIFTHMQNLDLKIILHDYERETVWQGRPSGWGKGKEATRLIAVHCMYVSKYHTKTH